MCHALLNNIKFLHQLVRIDQELADQTRLQGCPCGGTLHQAHFPRTGLWQAMCARFMPPVDPALLPAVLLSRFPGALDEAMRRLLMFLTPLTGAMPVTLREAR